MQMIKVCGLPCTSKSFFFYPSLSIFVEEPIPFPSLTVLSNWLFQFDINFGAIKYLQKKNIFNP